MCKQTCSGLKYQETVMPCWPSFDLKFPIIRQHTVQHINVEEPNERLLRCPAPEYLCNNRTAWIIRIAQMHPIRQLQCPSLVMDLVYECPVFGQDAVRCHTCYTFTFSVYGLGVPGPGTQGREVGGGVVRGPRQRVGGHERLVKALYGMEVRWNKNKKVSHTCRRRTRP